MSTLLPHLPYVLLGAIIGSLLTLVLVAAFMMYIANRTGAKAEE